jgi:hypothetical protein
MQLPRTFDPESVSLMSRVCYDAWWELKTSVPYASRGAEHTARDLLALSVMEAVGRGERDPDTLRNIAIGSGRDPVERYAQDGSQEKTLRLARV